MSTGSAGELEYLFLPARDISILPQDDYENLNVAVIEVKRMLASLIARLKADR